MHLLAQHPRLSEPVSIHTTATEHESSVYIVRICCALLVGIINAICSRIFTSNSKALTINKNRLPAFNYALTLQSYLYLLRVVALLATHATQ